MNQILITEKIYVTPELKRKRIIYKIFFIISILCVFLLSTYYIYAEYDRNKNEEISHQILAQIEDNTTVQEDDGILRVILSEYENNVESQNEEQEMQTSEESEITQQRQYTVDNGTSYATEARLNIQSLRN